jgi:hypothetical protein
MKILKLRSNSEISSFLVIKLSLSFFENGEKVWVLRVSEKWIKIISAILSSTNKLRWNWRGKLIQVL